MSNQAPTPLDAQTRERFKRQPRRDTKPELAIRREPHRRGFRFHLDVKVSKSIRSKPDIVFSGAKVAVFVDRCFWHGCPDHETLPKNNRQRWAGKLRANTERDTRTTATLKAEGWEIVRIWEHELVNEAVERIAAAVTAGS
jgi:DNA mismatch endonuclease (patch repair protein)